MLNRVIYNRLISIMPKYRFGKLTTEYNDNRYKPTPGAYLFYQLCAYPESSGRYNIRVLQFDQDNQIVDMHDKQLSQTQYEDFICRHRATDYKQYATADLSMVGAPNGDDLVKVHSELL